MSAFSQIDHHIHINLLPREVLFSQRECISYENGHKHIYIYIVRVLNLAHSVLEREAVYQLLPGKDPRNSLLIFDQELP